MSAFLHVQVLGHFALTLGGEVVPPGSVRRRKVRSLIKVLALDPSHALARDAVIDLLWSELDPAAGAAQLYNALLGLRKTLGDAAPRLAQGVVRLAPPGGLSVDAVHFRAAAEEALASREAPRLAAAAALFTGPLLPEDLYEDWSAEHRAALNDLYLRVLEVLVQAQPETAEATLQRMLALDPAHEEAHLALLRLHRQRPAKLQAQFEQYVRVRRDELGAEPSDEARAIVREAEAQSASSPHPLNLQGRGVSLRPSLPAPPTPLVGREEEVQAALACLLDPAVRLLTLVGPGGNGKTRLALDVAWRAAEREDSPFPDGVVWVSAGAATDDTQLPTAVLTAMGRAVGPNPEAQLADELRGRRTLLALDNLEHLPGAPAWVARTLAAAPTLKVLATSRTLLRLQAERPLDVRGLNRSDAALFFETAARRVQADYRVPDEDATRLARLCDLLAGSPLAVELAASWVRAMTLAEMLEEVERDLDVLERPAPDRDARHSGLRTVFEGSWALLEGAERSVLKALSVFTGRFSVAAARAVASCGRATLSALADRSLVQMDEGRLELHPLVRQYVQEQAEEQPQEQARWREAHARYHLTWAQDVAKRLKTPDPRAFRDVRLSLAAELDNTREAWRYARALDQVALLEQALPAVHEVHSHGQGLLDFVELLTDAHDLPPRLASRCALYRGVSRASLGSGEAVTDIDAADAGDLSDDERLMGWTSRAYALGRIGRGEEALRDVERALNLSRRLATPQARYLALNTQAQVLMYLHRLAEAEVVLSEVVALPSLSPVQQATTLAERATLIGRQGHFARAEADLGRALELLDALGDSHNAQTVRLNLGMALQSRGAYAESAALLQEAERQSREQGNQRTLASTRLALMTWHFVSGRARTALELGEENVRLCEASGNLSTGRLTLIRMSEVHLGLNEYDEAERLLHRALDAPTPVLIQNAQVGLALLAWRRGRHADARAWLETAGPGRTPALALRRHTLEALLAEEAGDAALMRASLDAFHASLPLTPEPYASWCRALVAPLLTPDAAHHPESAR
ncbi:ATP-binding protein [Deinococcus yavapaiensis]|uniref:DNA-binding SARP family transcriptional activator n=1 Tax=Deinococcus yavapaiensis KR-236 TaxID=694435 RepID=A0A318SQH2_9DEIO|nr:NB-ARC domain-containing protein [Deinococcus yavapaiensis]PYE55023.1 DNA-binding SARP family transcriptional activator [Deinococcus yavapaiensis KR-236]